MQACTSIAKLCDLLCCLCYHRFNLHYALLMIPVWEHDETPSLGLEWLGMSKRALQWGRLAQLGGCIATGVYVWSLMFQIQLASWNPMVWLSVSAPPNLQRWIHTH